MMFLRFEQPSTLRLIGAATDCAALLASNPSLPDGLAANASLVAAGVRLFGFPFYRNGRAVLRRLSAATIADYAEKIYNGGMTDGGTNALKKSSRVCRVSGSGGGIRAKMSPTR